METFDIREWKKKQNKPKKLINEAVSGGTTYGSSYTIDTIKERVKGIAGEPSVQQVWKKTKSVDAIWNEIVRLASVEIDEDIKEVAAIGRLQKKELKNQVLKSNTLEWLMDSGPTYFRTKK